MKIGKATKCIIARYGRENGDDTEAFIEEVYDTLLKTGRNFKNSRTTVVNITITDNIASIKEAIQLVRSAPEYSATYEGIVSVKQPEVLLSHLSETHIELFEEFINETCKDAFLILLVDKGISQKDLDTITSSINIKEGNICTTNISHQRKR